MAAGLYLYCLREPSGNSAADGTCHALSVITAPGVNGPGGVSIRAFDGVEAVVSAVDLKDFGVMQKKAQEDIHWIREKALAHEAVVEEAMGLSRSERNQSINSSKNGDSNPSQFSPDLSESRDRTAATPDNCSGRSKERQWPDSIPVIPVKFGVIFNNEERLAKVIREQSAAIKAAFDRIRAKEEWSVKLFLKDNQTFKEQVREQSEPLSAKSQALAALPAGRAYFMEQELGEELDRECSRRLDEEAMKIFEELKHFAAEATFVKILDGKLTGRRERMVLNSAYLVADSHLPDFENAVAKLREKFAPAGFLLEQGGPWPAYHFTEFINIHH